MAERTLPKGGKYPRGLQVTYNWEEMLSDLSVEQVVYSIYHMVLYSLPEGDDS